MVGFDLNAIRFPIADEKKKDLIEIQREAHTHSLLRSNVKKSRLNIFNCTLNAVRIL